MCAENGKSLSLFDFWVLPIFVADCKIFLRAFFPNTRMLSSYFVVVFFFRLLYMLKGYLICFYFRCGFNNTRRIICWLDKINTIFELAKSRIDKCAWAHACNTKYEMSVWKKPCFRSVINSLNFKGLNDTQAALVFISHNIEYYMGLLCMESCVSFSLRVRWNIFT